MHTVKIPEVERHALWVLLIAKSDRDGCWLKPSPWEGPGEYQHVTLADGTHCLRKVPHQ